MLTQATITYVCTVRAVCATIFSTSGKFRLVSNFTELHALTPAARSYALLLRYMGGTKSSNHKAWQPPNLC